MLLRARNLLLQSTIRLGQALGTLLHPGELTPRFRQILGDLRQLVLFETVAYRVQLPEELLISVLKGSIEFRMLPRPTQHLSGKPGEVIQLLLETLLHGVERLLLCLIQLVEGLLIDVLRFFDNFFLALDQISQLV